MLSAQRVLTHLIHQPHEAGASTGPHLKDGNQEHRRFSALPQPRRGGTGGRAVGRCVLASGGGMLGPFSTWVLGPRK